MLPASGGIKNEMQDPRRSLLGLPAELLIIVHLAAANPNLPLTCRLIHGNLHSIPVSAKDKADWVLSRWEIHSRPSGSASDQNLTTRRTIGPDGLRLVAHDLSSFILTSRPSRSVNVLREICRTMLLEKGEGGVLEYCQRPFINVSHYLQTRSLPSDVIHFLYHQQNFNMEDAREALYKVLQRGDIMTAEAMLEAGVIPTDPFPQNERWTSRLKALKYNEAALKVLLEWRPGQSWDALTNEDFRCTCGWSVNSETFKARLFDPRTGAPHRPNAFLQASDLVRADQEQGQKEETWRSRPEELLEGMTLSDDQVVRVRQAVAHPRSVRPRTANGDWARPQELRILWALMRYEPRLADSISSADPQDPWWTTSPFAEDSYTAYQLLTSRKRWIRITKYDDWDVDVGPQWQQMISSYQPTVPSYSVSLMSWRRALVAIDGLLKLAGY